MQEEKKCPNWDEEVDWLQCVFCGRKESCDFAVEAPKSAYKDPEKATIKRIKRHCYIFVLLDFFTFIICPAVRPLMVLLLFVYGLILPIILFDE